MANVIINFKNGNRAFLRSHTNSRYEDGRLMACHKPVIAKRRHLAATLSLSDAEDWVNDAHNKKEWLNHNNIFYCEVL